MRGQRFVRTVWILVGLVVALLIVKFFFADVYRISSGSMRPTLFGGAARDGDEAFNEWVLVAYGPGEGLKRFDLVVVSREGEDPVVKRVVGLPGESIVIDGGDVLINGERLGVDAPRLVVPVFDDAYLPVDDYFEFRRGDRSPWSESDDRVWTLDAANVAAGSDGGMMLFQPDVRDGYLDQEQRRVPGRRTVNDVTLECEFALDRDGGTLRFRLVEKADTFDVRIAAAVGDEFGTSHTVELVRSGAPLLRRADPSKQDEILARVGLDLELSAWTAARFSNIDNLLTLEIGETFRLTVPYDANVLFPGIAPGGDHSVGPRAGFGGEQTRARFRRIRISRDLHYTSFPPDGYAIESPVYLADDEVFLLGDNSAASNDSRRFGPVPLADLAGRPVWVVWPLARVRSLRATPESR